MKRYELEVAKREVTGKKVRFLRRQGITPGNIYGHGIDSVPVQVDTKSLKHLLAHVGKTDLISLKVNGSKAPVLALVRDVQKSPITDELLHVDFYQVKMTEKIKVDVPLAFVGEAPVMEKVKGASILHLIDSLHIEALPDHLPHNVEVDLSSLVDIDSTIHVRDIRLGDGITLLSDPDQMVVKVVEARKEVAPPVAEAKEEVERVTAEEAEAEAGAEEE